MKRGNVSNILYVSSFPPRECGIATFTKDLTRAMDHKFNPALKSKILAINDNGSSIYNYGGKVKYQLSETDIEEYMTSAERINKSKKIKLVCVQHEFGIFGGGGNGEFLVPFLEKLQKPCVVTFHSVCPEPSEERIKVVRAIARRAAAIIVMAKKGVEILKEVYGIDPKKVYYIPHGIPSINYSGRKEAANIKRALGLEGRTILSTFGLINPCKGIEYVIKALPEIVKKYPDVLYLVIGETHPAIRKKDGEKYRNSLIALAEKLGLKSHVKFYNKYLTLEEIKDYLKATDIYMFVSQDPTQIVSGTLSYAFGAGKPIVATRSLHAVELLQEGKLGFLVNFGEYEGVRKALNILLANPEYREELGKKAYETSRCMLWQNVAAEYLKVFKSIIEVNENLGLYKFPKIKIQHLINMTDDTGIIEHAKHSIPDRSSGYTLDDNTRALIVTTQHYNKYGSESSVKLVQTYLGYIYHSQKADGSFHNRISYDKKFLDEAGSEDAFGRAVWATGFVVASKLSDNIKSNAKFIFDNAMKNIYNLDSIRPKAFAILGLYNYYKAYKHPDILEKVESLANSLVEEYNKNKTETWKWFEDSITYSNGQIPEAMFFAYALIKKQEYLEVAEKSLEFLTSLVMINKQLVLIGHNGWYNRGSERAFYDQQPVDAASMVQAYMTAYKTTGNRDYYEKAAIAYNWFLGKNSINQVVYDESTGGCYDGLLPGCVNLNQGAESTISHLLARLSLDIKGDNLDKNNGLIVI